tara:strand:- start:219 stop:683 length:465 start_codon:yes stop_codon:yes gene_type:complete
MISKFKYHNFFVIILLVILNACQLQDTIKPHGIIYLENRSKKLDVNKSNKNDVIKIMGQPQITSFENEDIWIYAERILTKDKIHKLGKNILRENNILSLRFNKYGILIEKTFIDKNDMKKISFSQKKTENEISQRSFIRNFLESIRQKMYENKK